VYHVESKWKSDLHIPFQPSHMGTQPNCHSGVSQGSHLGPLFVVAGINDVLDIFENVGVLAYADDLKLYIYIYIYMYTCVLAALTIVVCCSRTWTVYKVDVVRRNMT
jgi:hypothetical protein